MTPTTSAHVAWSVLGPQTHVAAREAGSVS